MEARYLELWCEAACSFGLLRASGTTYETHPEHRLWLEKSQGFTQSHLHLSRRVSETLKAVFGGRALPEPPISLRLLLQESLQSNYEWIFQEGANVCPELHDCLNKASRVLEIGCGIGQGLAYLRDYHPSLELFGLEADYECAQEAERTTKPVIHLGETPAKRFQREFDLIVCFRTLSASVAPEELLSECVQMLNPGGLLLLGSEVDDKNSNRKSEARLKGERFAYNILAGESLVNSFSSKDIRDLVSRCGLTIRAEIKAPDWATPSFVCSTA